jgi:uncharacterized protein (TIGR04255 family)
MSERAKYRPFTGDSEKSVRLLEAPLELVLCQVRWPELSFLLEESFRPLALRLGQAILDYPVFSEAKEVNYSITPEGVSQNIGGSVFQWSSADQIWHISLARRFLSFYCTRYGGYVEFNERLVSVLERAQDVLSIPLIDRIGVRYVNRLADAALLENLGGLIRPPVLGYQALPPVAGQEVALLASTNHAIYSVGDASLQVRSGIVPANETVDPAISPLPAKSWVLDLDASAEARAAFDASMVADKASRLSDIAYDYFKFVITEGFEDRFGRREP